MRDILAQCADKTTSPHLFSFKTPLGQKFHRSLITSCTALKLCLTAAAQCCTYQPSFSFFPLARDVFFRGAITIFCRSAPTYPFLLHHCALSAPHFFARILVVMHWLHLWNPGHFAIKCRETKHPLRRAPHSHQRHELLKENLLEQTGANICELSSPRGERSALIRSYLWSLSNYPPLPYPDIGAQI